MSKQGEINLDALHLKPWSEMSPRERDAAIAERVMGWPAADVERERTHDGSTYFSPSADSDGGLPHYTTEHDAARLVEDEIERRGLLIDYLYKLYDMLGKLVMYENYISIKDVAVMLRATPEQRCEAAWRAMLDTGDSS